VTGTHWHQSWGDKTMHSVSHSIMLCVRFHLTSLCSGLVFSHSMGLFNNFPSRSQICLVVSRQSLHRVSFFDIHVLSALSCPSRLSKYLFLFCRYCAIGYFMYDLHLVPTTIACPYLSFHMHLSDCARFLVPNGRSEFQPRPKTVEHGFLST
jgi:hypothetical protein